MDLRLFVKFDKGALSKFTRDGLLILSENEKVMYVLKGTAELICKMADGKKTVDEIIDGITEEFDVDRNTARKDVVDFLGKTTKENPPLFIFCSNPT